MRATRRKFLHAASIGIGAGMLLPQPAEAKIFVTIFRIASFSFAKLLGLGITTGLVALGAVRAVRYGIHSSFTSNSYSYSDTSSDTHATYTAHSPEGWKPQEPPKPIVISVSCDPRKKIDGEILRLRAIEHGVLNNDGIMLPRGGRLIINADGTMEFADTQFKGFASIQENGDMTCTTRDHQLALTRIPRATDFVNIHHDSHAGRTALVSLLGDIDHA